MTKLEILKQYFGHEKFRSGQEDITDNILSGKDVLGIMPTGAGKSVCYQVPAMLMDGITIVISPLISLMKDQVRSLTESGIPSAYINSSLSYRQLREVFKRAAEMQYKIIYVAPERLVTDDFLDFAENSKISMVTVDEAHCVSQWGQDFRPSYLKISEFIDTLSYRPVVSAFTATATKRVSVDICNILKLDNPFRMVTGFDRKNLYFEVQNPKYKLNALVDILNRPQNKEKSGIVYCISRKGVEEVCDELISRGFAATRYHAGLDDEERRINQDDFIYDRKTVMVATNAFGMGIDKSNVSYVVHYNMPKNIESYYQEAGRAGRDGEPAECVLLYAPKDVRINKFLIENGNENLEMTEEMRRQVIKKDLELLKHMTFYCNTYDCLRGFILKYFGETAPICCDSCSNCNTRFETVDITEEAQKILSCIYRIKRQGRAFGKNMVADVLCGSKNDNVISRHLDELTTYGIMSGMTKTRVMNIIEFLVQSGYIIKDEDNFNILVPTEKSKSILFGGDRLSMKAPKEKKAKKKPVQAETVNEGLFSKLRDLRKELAERGSVPAYVIFSDASLRDMCRILPKTLDEFETVSGVGSAKLQRYGELFVNEINDYLRIDK